MNNNLEQTHTTVFILMNRSFRDFGNQQREDFLNDLSDLVAYPREEFYEVKFWDGCVAFQALLPVVAFIRLLETFKLAKKEEKNSEEVIEMQEFTKKHSVYSITNPSIDNQFLESTKELQEHLAEIARFSRQKPKLAQKSKRVYFIHGWRWEGEFVKKECSKTFSKLPEFLSVRFNGNSDFFDYQTGLTTKSKSLYYVAKALSNKLHESYLEYTRTPETEKEKDFKIALITHSAGGIVARKCMTLTTFQEERNNYVKHITLIASPATGVRFLNPLAKFPFTSDQIRELKQGSAFIAELNSNWGHWSKLNSHCKVRCIYGPEDQVVSATEASILDPDAICILGVDHVNIKNVDSLNDELYKTLVSFLEEANFQT